MAWSPRGSELLLTTLRGRVLRYDMAEKRPVSSKQTGHRRAISAMLWTADEAVVLASARLVSVHLRLPVPTS